LLLVAIGRSGAAADANQALCLYEGWWPAWHFAEAESEEGGMWTSGWVRSRGSTVVVATSLLVTMAVAPLTGAAETRAKAPVGVWSGAGGVGVDYGQNYVVLAIANGPAGNQQAFFAFDVTNPEGVCNGGPAVIGGKGDYESFGNGDGQMALTGDFICADTNEVAPFSPVTVVVQYHRQDRWRADTEEGVSEWWVRRCVDPAATTPQGGVPNIKVGTNGNDRLVGTNGHDVLDGRGGNDKLIGKGGIDILCGAKGKDTLKGNAGIDVMLGGAGNDRGVGGAGVDFALGGGGRDTLLGGAGTDFLLGEKKNDVIKGQAGPNDLAHGGGGSDKCIAETKVACEK
jgi:Ca2+-binding RTX toxin-like protein